MESAINRNFKYFFAPHKKLSSLCFALCFFKVPYSEYKKMPHIYVLWIRLELWNMYNPSKAANDLFSNNENNLLLCFDWRDKGMHRVVGAACQLRECWVAKIAVTTSHHYYKIFKSMIPCQTCTIFSCMMEIFTHEVAVLHSSWSWEGVLWDISMNPLILPTVFITM